MSTAWRSALRHSSLAVAHGSDGWLVPRNLSRKRTQPRVLWTHEDRAAYPHAAGGGNGVAVSTNHMAAYFHYVACRILPTRFLASPIAVSVGSTTLVLLGTSDNVALPRHFA